MDILYHHAFIDGLAHVVDGQRRHGRRGERLHLDAGPVGGGDGGGDDGLFPTLECEDLFLDRAGGDHCIS